MAHFTNITSFAELKKQYRTLAIANHPDKGGDTKTMQEINSEFDKLYKVWEHRKDKATSRTGYENDFDGATSSQYQEYVYNEYRWRGSRYNGQNPPEIIETVRQWLKDTYKNCKFSATRRNYNSLSVYLITANFEVFNEENKNLVNCQLNPYHCEKDERLTPRAIEVMENVRNYIMSYNYDNSDAMTDYFDTNFYLHLGIGRYDKPFEVVVPQLACPKGKEAPVFKFPEGKAHKAIRKALDGAIFGEITWRTGEVFNVLGEINYYNSGESFGAKYYSAPKTAAKRIAKLEAAGIMCHHDGRNYIHFDGYTPDTIKALEQEVQAEKVARETWEANLLNPKPKTPKESKEPKASKENIETIVAEGIEIIENYSERAFAIIGNTKPIKEKLKELGGRFNPKLTCGAGWVFPKSKIDTIKEALSIAA